MKKKVISANILVGGKNDCVQISAPFNGDMATLMWLGVSKGRCEINDRPVSGINTIILVNLAFNILKLYTNIKFIELIDSSVIEYKKDDIYEESFKILFFI